MLHDRLANEMLSYALNLRTHRPPGLVYRSGESRMSWWALLTFNGVRAYYMRLVHRYMHLRGFAGIS